jgi:hypothetical protein
MHWSKTTHPEEHTSHQNKCCGNVIGIWKIVHKIGELKARVKKNNHSRNNGKKQRDSEDGFTSSTGRKCKQIIHHYKRHMPKQNK